MPRLNSSLIIYHQDFINKLCLLIDAKRDHGCYEKSHGSVAQPDKIVSTFHQNRIPRYEPI
jgi:hypothetical protein